MSCHLTPPSSVSWTAILRRHRAQLANERAARDEADETIEQLRESLESRDIEISRLRAELTRREAECDRLADDFAGSIAHIADLELDLVDRLTASVGLRALVDKRTNELLVARDEAEAAKAIATELAEKLEALGDQADEWRSEAALARRDADGWQEDACAHLRRCGELEAALLEREATECVCTAHVEMP